MSTKPNIKEFIDNSPTSFHAAHKLAEMIEAQGGIKLAETKRWDDGTLCPGGIYYVLRNDSALIAFQMPENVKDGYRIYSAHSDSPCFKIKENPDMKCEAVYNLLNVEKYGGMILSTWLDRPLGVAGRIMIRQDNEIVTKLVNLSDMRCIIPNLAIHMNRDMNKGVEYNVQTHMRPIFGLGEDCPTLQQAVARELQVAQEDILGKELYLYSAQPCMTLGISGDMLAGPRLDDLECAYVGTIGFLNGCQTNAEDKKYVSVLAIFDNEEVGSGTKQGADSTFLIDVLERIENALEMTPEDSKCMRAGSFMISADNAHAVHPNYPEKADPTNRPVINGGLVIKYHGGQKYTTDAASEALFREICQKAAVNVQTYANRSDLPGGSTLGNISTSHLSITSVDIGLPQLAMHSACETAGMKDLDDLQKVVEMYFCE